MKVAINAGILDDKPSGLGIYTINVVSKLAQAAVDNLVVYTSAPEMLAASRGVEIRKLSPTLQPKYGKKAGLSRFVWNQLGFPLSLNGADLIYCTTHHGILWGRTRQVITVHDLLPIKFPDQCRLQNYYFSFILPRLINKAAAVITISESTKNDLHQHYKLPLEKIHVIYNGIDHSQFTVQPDDVIRQTKQKYGLAEYFLVVGASYPHKNVHRVLQAFAKIQDSISPETELAISGGRREYVDMLKREAEKLGVRAVRFLEYVPFRELSALYSGATALVYPSLYEGFGFPPLEAMACGCPVITSNISSLPEVCGDGALYVDPYDVEAIAEAITRLASDEALREQLRIKGLMQAKLFDWDKTAQGILEVLTRTYEEVKA